MFFGYEAEGDVSSAMAFCTADKNGRLVREEWFEPPYVAMVHDSAITRDYVKFPIMPRAGTVADLRRFKMPTTFAFIELTGVGAEDAGYYINIADRHDQNRSDLLVFDACHIDRGPIATVRLPLRLRSAFHRTWVPASRKTFTIDGTANGSNRRRAVSG